MQPGPKIKMFCFHLTELADKLQPPRPGQQVHKEECTQCFDDQDRPEGIVVCLHCFNGGCTSDDDGHGHARKHAERAGHVAGLGIKRTRKPLKQRDDAEPPMKKLQIEVVADEEIYEYTTELRCFACGPRAAIHPDVEAKLAPLVDAVMRSMAAAQQSEVKAWEEEIVACEHTLMLEQESLIEAGKVSPTCSHCDLASNLWLCLTCGLVNCGRQQFGGLGGNGHALQHYEETGHVVGVKLGTITPEGAGDIYCYSCNDAKIDPELARHLATFGIEVAGQSKTEKSMTELQIEHNLKFDFSMTGDDGKEMRPVFGLGLTGLKNLGNSCYMASVLQCLFALPAFADRYATSAEAHFASCTVPLPADCLDCQMHKIATGLLSGRYSVPARLPPAPSTRTEAEAEAPAETDTPRFQEGIQPAMFKALVGKGHEEFATMRQQDSEEFLQHLLKVLRQDAQRRGATGDEGKQAASTFEFALEQRLMCGECRGVRYSTERVDSVSLPVEANETPSGEDGVKAYQPVELERCLAQLVGAEELEYSCPSCKKTVSAQKETKFKTLPDTLVLHMKKFQLVNWLPTKLDVPVTVKDDIILDGFLGKGLQADERELEDAPEASAEPEFNAAALAQLESMGFPTVRCQKALLATGNSDPEAAMNWLFEHMDDAGLDDPIPSKSAGGTSGSAAISPETVSMLQDMGFTEAQARKALRETDANMERAVEWLFSHPDDNGEETVTSAPSAPAALPGSGAVPANYRLRAFISHKGPSVHSGHYVATIKQDDGSWVLFNDEKVAVAEGEANERMKSLAYLYIYERST